MLVHGPFYAKYGVQTTFYVTLEDISDAEAPFSGTAPLVADIWLSKDGGAAAAATNAMSSVAFGNIYSWTATATEMQATRLTVSVYDATASAIFKPITIHIVTKLQIGQLDADASALSNTHGIICTGVGTGVGLKTVGATTALTHNLFDIVEAAEPSAALSSLDSFWNIIKWMKRRFNNKATVDATSLIVYKDNSSTVLSTQAVSDDGTTDTVGKAS